MDLVGAPLFQTITSFWKIVYFRGASYIMRFFPCSLYFPVLLELGFVRRLGLSTQVAEQGGETDCTVASPSTNTLQQIHWQELFKQRLHFLNPCICEFSAVANKGEEKTTTVALLNKPIWPL